MLNELGIAADLSTFEAVLMHDTGAVLTKKEFDGTGRALALTQDEGKGIPYNSNKQLSLYITLSHSTHDSTTRGRISLSHTHTHNATQKFYIAQHSARAAHTLH